MNAKKIAATAAISGAMGLTAIGIGAGTAQADDHGGWGCWGFPCDGFQGPPGQNPLGIPPGQLKKIDNFGPFDNPVEGVPPGHWDDVPLWGWH
jgi:hypothetical protein